MTNDSTYQTYAMYFIKDVPSDNLKYLIKLFANKAAMNMGNELPPRTLEGMIDIIKENFTYLPISYIASGFIKGSLGHFGAGRLVPRTVYGWLNEIALEYHRNTAKERLKAIEDEILTVADLHTYPFGKAILQKVKWYEAGKLDGDLWDRVDLKELATAIGKGEVIEFENFYK